MKQALQWHLSYSAEKEGELSQSIPASVPGCVQLDMAAATGMHLYYSGDYEESFRWMENKFWHYEAQIMIENNENVPFLCFDGVDYEYEVHVNGMHSLYHEGMFSKTEIDLTAFRGQMITVEVIVYPAPKVKDCVYERGLGNEAAQSCKPAFNYGWDWCPRFVTLGIVDEAYVEYRLAERITDLQISYKLADSLESADITLEYAVSAQGELLCEIISPDGSVALKERFPTNCEKKQLTLYHPQLWWPHNHGKQPRYIVSLSLLVHEQVTDSRTVHIGLRRIRLVPNEKTWEEQMETEMKTCAKPPMTLEVNGRRIFAKGSNWVPPELCRAQMKKDHICRLLTLLKDANMNIIRMWGGGYIHPDWFYDLCDELGIMVWQEFPLACSDYKDNDRYLAVLEQESKEIILKLRNHPCLAIWCGGNELFTDWSRMTPQHKAVRLLDAQTLSLDPDTPFLYTSPQTGVAHGAYEMLLKSGRETLTEFCNNSFSAYTEFGCGAPSQWEYLGTFMTEDERANPFCAPIWEKRHALRWFDPEGIRVLTGCAEDWESIIAAGNEAQCVMYAGMFEEVRRQWPHASMAINWCYNEPWPTAAGNGLVNYPALPRPCYEYVKKALQGQKLSLRFSRIAWKPGEELTITPWMLNDTSERMKAGTAQICVLADGRQYFDATWHYEETDSWTNQKGTDLLIPVPKTNDGRLTLRITSKRDSALNAEYRLFIHENAILLEN